MPDFLIFCGDSWGNLPKNSTNLRPGEFFLGSQPYKPLCPLSIACQAWQAGPPRPLNGKCHKKIYFFSTSLILCTTSTSTLSLKLFRFLQNNGLRVPNRIIEKRNKTLLTALFLYLRQQQFHSPCQDRLAPLCLGPQSFVLLSLQVVHITMWRSMCLHTRGRQWIATKLIGFYSQHSESPLMG